MTTQISESTVNIIAEGTHLEGKINFDQVSRVHGTLVGEVCSKDGSTLILSENSVVRGNIQADVLMVDGYVQGDIEAKTRVVISSTGRVIGKIKTRSLVIEFGAHFEGQCAMENSEASLTSGRALKPA